jgi:outer membrane protein OmpA-like peptidoglycan-associated protein
MGPDDTQVSPLGAAALHQSARVLNACATKFALASIHISRYSDNAGAAAASLELSKTRANAVRHVLLDAGVPPSSLLARSYGQLRPIRPNETELGRSQNRRVEFMPERND